MSHRAGSGQDRGWEQSATEAFIFILFILIFIHIHSRCLFNCCAAKLAVELFMNENPHRTSWQRTKIRAGTHSQTHTRAHTHTRVDFVVP